MKPDLDLTPWAFALSIAATVFGPKFAAYVSAYGLILLGWFGGFLFGLYNRSPEAKLPVWAYGVVTFIMCLMVTVTASQILVSAIPGFAVEYTSALFPVAFAIAGFPDYWGKAGAWALERWQAVRGVKQ